MLPSYRNRLIDLHSKLRATLAVNGLSMSYYISFPRCPDILHLCVLYVFSVLYFEHQGQYMGAKEQTISHKRLAFATGIQELLWALWLVKPIPTKYLDSSRHLILDVFPSILISTIISMANNHSSEVMVNSNVMINSGVMVNWVLNKERFASWW